MSRAVLALLVVTVSVAVVSGGRCGTTTIGFRTQYNYTTTNKSDNEGKRCRDFEAKYNPVDQSYGRNTYEGRCKIKVCGDGRPVVGTYCGKGPCNIFGYNCDGGCIEGDPVESFKQIHDANVWDIQTL